MQTNFAFHSSNGSIHSSNLYTLFYAPQLTVRNPLGASGHRDFLYQQLRSGFFFKRCGGVSTLWCRNNTFGWWATSGQRSSFLDWPFVSEWNMSNFSLECLVLKLLIVTVRFSYLQHHCHSVDCRNVVLRSNDLMFVAVTT